MKLLTFLFLLLAIISCKSKKASQNEPFSGYIVSLENKSLESIDNTINFWYLEKADGDLYYGESPIFKSYYMLLKDNYDFQLCCQDKNVISNDKFAQLPFKDIEIPSFSLFKNTKSLVINIDNQNTIKIYKVSIAQCICSKEYSLFPNLSQLEQYSYPIGFTFKRFENNEKKNFKKNYRIILEILK